MVEITGVLKGTAAHKHGIKAGDHLISINGNAIKDILDYRYYLCEKKLTLLICRDGKEITVNLKKGEYDDIGLEFETFLMDKKHSCRNKCIFCFIDQLPRGMRDTLYFKDDDSRLSFLQGNYITMTNLTDEDVDRIIKMKMSPINVSVHTTNPELRTFMLKNPNAAKSLSYLERFAKAGTELNCQIVLCRGINDGEELTRTMHDLAALYPSVMSVSIVPAGMTKFREEKGLYPLTPFTAEEAKAVIRQIESFAEGCLAHYGSRIFYAGDELYLEAGLPIPDAEYYEGFHAIEDALTEFTGLDPDKISFDITLSAELGVDPNAEVVKIWNYERNGTAVPLTLGTKGYGKYRWNILNHKMKLQHFDRSGNVTHAVVSVSLQEYLGG